MKTSISIIVVGFLLFCLSCTKTEDAKKNPENMESTTSGNVEILCDESIYDLMKPTFKMYDSAYPQAKVTVLPVPAREAMAQLLAGKSRGIILARPYLRDEDSLMKVYKVSRHLTMPIARDALVFFTRKDFPLDTISREQLQEILLSKEPLLKKYFPRFTAEPIFISPNMFSSVYANLLLSVTNEKAPLKSMLTVNSSDSVKLLVKSKGNAIGIGYLSQIIADTTLKALRVGFTDTTGFRQRPRLVHQAYIVLGYYPFPVSIKAYLAEDLRNLPWGFATQLSKDTQTQQYFLKSGIVPAYANIKLIEPAE